MRELPSSSRVYRWVIVDLFPKTTSEGQGTGNLKCI